MNVLVIAVHPDDETLGCGGTILKHVEHGDSVHWLIITTASESLGYSKTFIESREIQIEQVAKAYGFKSVSKLGLPTTRLHTVDFSEIVRSIQAVLNTIRPDIAYTVNHSDIHSDHQTASRAFFSAAKTFKAPFLKKVMMYECLSETEAAPPLVGNAFLPNVYSDIGEYLEKKADIMGIYESEVQPSPLPRSIDSIAAQARFRGTAVCVKYAEAFMLVRDIF